MPLHTAASPLDQTILSDPTWGTAGANTTIPFCSVFTRNALEADVGEAVEKLQSSIVDVGPRIQSDINPLAPNFDLSLARNFTLDFSADPWSVP